MKRKCQKRLVAATAAAVLICSLFSGAALPELSSPKEEETAKSSDFAEDEIYYVSIEPDKVSASNGAVGGEPSAEIETASGVTEDMCSASFWYDRTQTSGIASDHLLITKDEIYTLNDEMLHTPDAYMNDLEAMEESYNADKLRNSLAESAMELSAKKTIYADQVLVTDKEEYFGRIKAAILNTGYIGESRQNQYAVAVRRTLLSSIPTKDYIGYSATDADDEKASSAINVNEPFIIRQKATVDGSDFYWGYSINCTGWVNAEDLAICADRAEWLDAWKVDIDGNNFVVVTPNQITLEPSVFSEELSEVKLTFATILKTVPSDQRPSSIDERGPWNNYMVYLPTRKADGSYQKRCALISQHYELSIGFLPMTQQQILRVAFNNLGDRYGWGGMLDSMDCSFFTRNVYRCFGLELPRNTTWQQAIPGRKIDLSGMSDEKKLEAISRMPSGTLLYFPGHTMIYTGMADFLPVDGEEAVSSKMAYVISDTGSLSDSIGELDVRSMYSVILNPLMTRRRAGTTWLANITAAVIPVSEEYFAFVSENIAKEETPEYISRVPLSEGQSYASSRDSLGTDSFLGSTKSLYLGFSEAKQAAIKDLAISVIKGSVVTTKSPVAKVECDKTVATVKLNKTTSVATVTLKKSGDVSFTMTDGKVHTVHFTVETPKAQTQQIKNLIKAAKEQGRTEISLSIGQLFGTQIDGGELKIVSQTGKGAVVTENMLTIPLDVKNTVRLRYQYLDKKYTLSISV